MRFVWCGHTSNYRPHEHPHTALHRRQCRSDEEEIGALAAPLTHSIPNRDNQLNESFFNYFTPNIGMTNRRHLCTLRYCSLSQHRAHRMAVEITAMIEGRVGVSSSVNRYNWKKIWCKLFVFSSLTITLILIIGLIDVSQLTLHISLYYLLIVD